MGVAWGVSSGCVTPQRKVCPVQYTRVCINSHVSSSGRDKKVSVREWVWHGVCHCANGCGRYKLK